MKDIQLFIDLSDRLLRDAQSKEDIYEHILLHSLENKDYDMFLLLYNIALCKIISEDLARIKSELDPGISRSDLQFDEALRYKTIVEERFSKIKPEWTSYAAYFCDILDDSNTINKKDVMGLSSMMKCMSAAEIDAAGTYDNDLERFIKKVSFYYSITGMNLLNPQGSDNEKLRLFIEEHAIFFPYYYIIVCEFFLSKNRRTNRTDLIGGSDANRLGMLIHKIPEIYKDLLDGTPLYPTDESYLYSIKQSEDDIEPVPFNLVLPEFKKGKTENVYDNIVKVGSDGKNISLYHPCAICGGQRPLMRNSAAARRSLTATLVRRFR